MEKHKTSNVSISNGRKRVLTTNLLQNLISDRLFYVTIADADIGSLKSLHTLFDKYLDDMLLEFE